MSTNATKIVAQSGKVFLVNLELERTAARKADKLARTMSPERRRVYLELVSALGDAIIWDRLREHVTDTIESTKPRFANFNIYDLQTSMTKVLKDGSKWVRTNETFSPEKVAEYRQQIAKAAHSICERVDGNASCWDLRKWTELVRGQ